MCVCADCADWRREEFSLEERFGALPDSELFEHILEVYKALVLAARILHASVAKSCSPSLNLSVSSLLNVSGCGSILSFLQLIISSALYTIVSPSECERM